MRLARRLRQERPPNDLGLTALSVLGRIDRDGPCTATEVAAAEGIQPQSLTRLLPRLQERGLIERTRDDGDRRQTLLAVTDSGNELLERDRRGRDEWLAVAMAKTLDAHERRQLVAAMSLLDKLSTVPR